MTIPGSGIGAIPAAPDRINQIASRSIPVLRVMRIAMCCTSKEIVDAPF